ncbi:hypothetical protein D9M71_445060 [compost metagenome]
MKRLACQCSETRVRENTETTPNRAKLPISEISTPRVSGSKLGPKGWLVSQLKPGKLSSGQPSPRAITGTTRV